MIDSCSLSGRLRKFSYQIAFCENYFTVDFHVEKGGEKQEASMASDNSTC